jgi:hypothetical protein
LGRTYRLHLQGGKVSQARKQQKQAAELDGCTSADLCKMQLISVRKSSDENSNQL